MIDSFVDDLIAHTQGWTTHLGCLRETFERISKAGLTVKSSKCQFGFRNLNFVGHTVGSGIQSLKRSVQEAQTNRQVKSFLGLVGFFFFLLLVGSGSQCWYRRGRLSILQTEYTR